jgi:hypothetical protein
MPLPKPSDLSSSKELFVNLTRRGLRARRLEGTLAKAL